jgi:hypothetical protein
MIAVYSPSGMAGWFREVRTPVEDPSAAPPPVTPELLARALEAGPRYQVERVDEQLATEVAPLCLRPAGQRVAAR